MRPNEVRPSHGEGGGSSFATATSDGGASQSCVSSSLISNGMPDSVSIPPLRDTPAASMSSASYDTAEVHSRRGSSFPPQVVMRRSDSDPGERKVSDSRSVAKVAPAPLLGGLTVSMTEGVGNLDGDGENSGSSLAEVGRSGHRTRISFSEGGRLFNKNTGGFQDFSQRNTSSDDNFSVAAADRNVLDANLANGENPSYSASSGEDLPVEGGDMDVSDNDDDDDF